MSDTSWVYVARSRDGFIKIGRSDDPRRRISNMQTANPHKITLFNAVRVRSDIAAFVEGVAHLEFEDSNVRGEWFLAEPDAAIRYVLRVAAIVESARHRRRDQARADQELREYGWDAVEDPPEEDL